MSQFNCSRSITRFSRLTTSLGFLLFGNFFLSNSANAFSINSGAGITNGGFEQSIDGTNPTGGWSTIGDATTNGASTVQFSNLLTGGTGTPGFVDPIAGMNQAIITTAFDLSSRVDDTNAPTMGPRIDLEFNQSGSDPVDADTDPNNHSGDDLQTFLGLDTDSLSIARENADPGATDPRTSKEGSGLSQTFTIEISAQDVLDGKNAFEVSFNWAYLTNDGNETDIGLGNQDFGFFTLYEAGDTDPGITVLGDSNSSIVDPLGNNNYTYGTTEFYDANNLYTQEISGLSEGIYNYTIGFGVVDIDGSGRSSALVLDNFGVEQVPFDFSPTSGFGLLFGLWGLRKARSLFHS